MAPYRAIDYARQTAEGLAAAHAKGIVHRDLKPDNLFVTIDDRIKILDFGLAKLAQTTDTAIPAGADTEIGSVLGTTDYMSPEQVRGESVDIRTDIFSLGIILQEMLTCRAPFARTTAADTMAAILKDDPVAFLPAELPGLGWTHRQPLSGKSARDALSIGSRFGLRPGGAGQRHR